MRRFNHSQSLWSCTSVPFFVTPHTFDHMFWDINLKLLFDLLQLVSVIMVIMLWCGRRGLRT